MVFMISFDDWGGPLERVGDWGLRIRDWLEVLEREPVRVSFVEMMDGLFLRGAGSRYDDLVRTFCATRQLPPFSDRERFEMILRLRCAFWYCSEGSDGRALVEESPQSFLESLLLVYWHDVGQKDWLDEGYVQPSLLNYQE